VILATQRPSVDVITGTIKANFPTAHLRSRSPSKIDSRTIRARQGAEQLLGAGDMLYMARGGSISACTDRLLFGRGGRKVVRHLNRKARRNTSEAVTVADDETRRRCGLRRDRMGQPEGGDLYQQAVQVVMRDRKASTSYIQRRLQIATTGRRRSWSAWRRKRRRPNANMRKRVRSWSAKRMPSVIENSVSRC